MLDELSLQMGVSREEVVELAVRRLAAKRLEWHGRRRTKKERARP
jgi:hypothetical protein